jgi:hypothetical protein
VISFGRLHRTVNAGIVDENVNGAESGARSIDYRPAVCRPADVRGNEPGLASGSLNLPRHRFHLNTGSRSDEYPRAFGGEAQRDGTPDSAASTGHNGQSILQKHVCPLESRES